MTELVVGPDLSILVRLVQQQQICFYCTPGSFAVIDVMVQPVFHAQHLHICTHGHLAQAVGVEVELVLLKVLKVLEDMQEHFQRLHTDLCDRLVLLMSLHIDWFVFTSSPAPS